MVNVAFVRNSGRKVARGFVADHPFGIAVPLPYSDPFIVVQIDERTIPKEVLGTRNVQLKLDKLQGEEVEVTYTDEEGNEQTRTEYDYYSEKGKSSKPYPIITMEDVLYGE